MKAEAGNQGGGKVLAVLVRVGERGVGRFPQVGSQGGRALLTGGKVKKPASQEPKAWAQVMNRAGRPQ